LTEWQTNERTEYKRTNFSEIFLGGIIVLECVVEIYRTAEPVQHVRVIHVDIGRETRQVAKVCKQVQEEQNSSKPHPAETAQDMKSSKIFTQSYNH